VRSFGTATGAVTRAQAQKTAQVNLSNDASIKGTDLKGTITIPEMIATAVRSPTTSITAAATSLYDAVSYTSGAWGSIAGMFGVTETDGNEDDIIDFDPYGGMAGMGDELQDGREQDGEPQEEDHLDLPDWIKTGAQEMGKAAGGAAQWVGTLIRAIEAQSQVEQIPGLEGEGADGAAPVLVLISYLDSGSANGLHAPSTTKCHQACSTDDPSGFRPLLLLKSRPIPEETHRGMRREIERPVNPLVNGARIDDSTVQVNSGRQVGVVAQVLGFDKEHDGEVAHEEWLYWNRGEAAVGLTFPMLRLLRELTIELQSTFPRPVPRSAGHLPALIFAPSERMQQEYEKGNPEYTISGAEFLNDCQDTYVEAVFTLTVAVPISPGRISAGRTLVRSATPKSGGMQQALRRGTVRGESVLYEGVQQRRAQAILEGSAAIAGRRLGDYVDDVVVSRGGVPEFLVENSRRIVVVPSRVLKQSRESQLVMGLHELGHARVSRFLGYDNYLSKFFRKPGLVKNPIKLHEHEAFVQEMALYKVERYLGRALGSGKYQWGYVNYHLDQAALHREAQQIIADLQRLAR